MLSREKREIITDLTLIYIFLCPKYANVSLFSDKELTLSPCGHVDTPNEIDLGLYMLRVYLNFFSSFQQKNFYVYHHLSEQFVMLDFSSVGSVSDHFLFVGFFVLFSFVLVFAFFVNESTTAT